MSDLDIYLRALLRCWESLSFSMSLAFSEGVKKGSYNLSNSSCTIWIFCPIRYHWRSMLLYLGLRSYDRSYGGASFGILIVPKLPIFFGFFWSSRKDWSMTASNAQAILLPAFCFTCLLTEKVSAGWFPSIRWYFIVAVFPHVLWGDDKIELI